MVETIAGSSGSASDEGRRFRGSRKVRLGDVRTTGLLRLDALTRYTQDVSDDDTTSAGLDPDPGWVVRSTRVVVDAPARLDEELEFVTYCSALGRRWAERRLEITGSQGAAYQVVTLWVCIDPTSGRPRRLTDQFLSLFAASAGGRAVKARLTHPKPPTDAIESSTPWPLRAVDFDVYGHVNNAAYWAVFENSFADASENGFEATIEYSAGVGPDDEIRLVERPLDDGRHLIWLLRADGVLAASLSFRRSSAVEPG